MTWSLEIPDLPAELQRLVSQIPPGCVATYGDLASALGDVAAAKWVALQLQEAAFADTLPAHRVVRQTGEPGGYHRGDSHAKLLALQHEHVPILHDRVTLNRCRFAGFQKLDSPPLAKLRVHQTELLARVVSTPFDVHGLHRVMAVDVAYPEKDRARAAAVVYDGNTHEVVARHVVQTPQVFPYISGYLAYRELPAYAELWRQLPSSWPNFDVLLVDGNGQLHPRRAGIAVHLGVLVDRPTVGIGKKLLCGVTAAENITVDEPQPIFDEVFNPQAVVECADSHSATRQPTERIGMAMKSQSKSRPIYVSPAHRMDVDSAAAIARRLFRDHRLPEPLYHADRLSKQS